MNLYYVNTSHREGYTTEEPNLQLLNQKGEYVVNESSLRKSLFFAEEIQDQAYKIYMVENIRGDRVEQGVRYFTEENAAKTHYESVKDQQTNKMEKPYTLDTVQVHSTVESIPRRPELQLDPTLLSQQMARYADYRVSEQLTFDQKMAKYMESRQL